jgi:hypothetical protein
MRLQTKSKVDTRWVITKDTKDNLDKIEFKIVGQPEKGSMDVRMQIGIWDRLLIVVAL